MEARGWWSGQKEPRWIPYLVRADGLDSARFTALGTVPAT
jgi:hypothetical protein